MPHGLCEAQPRGCASFLPIALPGLCPQTWCLWRGCKGKAWAWLYHWLGGCGVGLLFPDGSIGVSWGLAHAGLLDQGIWSNGNLFQGLLEIPEWSSADPSPGIVCHYRNRRFLCMRGGSKAVRNLPLSLRSRLGFSGI